MEEHFLKKAARPLTGLTEFDPKDKSWWEWREMGSPDDPYNNIPKMSEDDPLRQEYVDIANNGWEVILKEFESDENWTFAKEEAGITIWSRDSESDPVRCFKGTAIIPASAEVLRLHLVQVDLRHFWDDMFLGSTYHLEVTPNVRIAYYKFSAPWPVAPRDFVLCAGEKLTDDGIFLSSVSSVERDDLPPVDGYVRGILRTSGYVVKPLENDENGKPQCSITYIVQLNPMGWIPTMIVNVVNVAQPMCINTLKNAILLTEAMIEECLVDLNKLPESDWKQPNIKKVLNRAIDRNNGKTEMLYEPLNYVVTGKRKLEGDVAEVMEKEGKEAVMRKLWTGSLPYLQSIANKELNSEVLRVLADSK